MRTVAMDTVFVVALRGTSIALALLVRLSHTRNSRAHIKTTLAKRKTQLRMLVRLRRRILWRCRCGRDECTKSRIGRVERAASRRAASFNRVRLVAAVHCALHAWVLLRRACRSTPQGKVCVCLHATKCYMDCACFLENCFRRILNTLTKTAA